MTVMTTERCGAVAEGIACDREPGHEGAHRGYLEAVDEVVFWRTLDDQSARRVATWQDVLDTALSDPWLYYAVTLVAQGMSREQALIQAVIVLATERRRLAAAARERHQ